MSQSTRNPLQDIPPGVRTALYWAGWLIGTIASGISAVWAAVAAASPDVKMPLWLIIVGSSATFISSQFHVMASQNVPSYVDVATGEADPPVD